MLSNAAARLAARSCHPSTRVLSCASPVMVVSPLLLSPVFLAGWTVRFPEMGCDPIPSVIMGPRARRKRMSKVRITGRPLPSGAPAPLRPASGRAPGTRRRAADPVGGSALVEPVQHDRGGPGLAETAQRGPGERVVVLGEGAVGGQPQRLGADTGGGVVQAAAAHRPTEQPADDRPLRSPPVL